MAFPQARRKIKALIVVGARPNFMKAAPLIRAMKDSGVFLPILVHTGQHYDYDMSKSFFEALGLPKPHLYLGVGSGTHGEQTAKVILAMENHLLQKTTRPDLVVVVGDVNSTLAAALAARKLNIPVAHVEAGLRSFDESIPEEINRRLTDQISSFLFITEESARKNLLREGIDAKKIHFVGNTMIDSLYKNMPQISASGILGRLNLLQRSYAVLTLHRPSNVDSRENFKKMLNIIDYAQKKLPVVFPMHPRTLKQLDLLGLKRRLSKLKRVVVTDPLGYNDFIKLVAGARFILTDSGGIQEEATVLKVPCITLRENTERPVTAEIGTNIIAGTNLENIKKSINNVLRGRVQKGKIPKYWDGRAAERVVKILRNHYETFGSNTYV